MARAAVAAAVILLPLAACGKKGPPLEPLRLAPAMATEPTLRRVGSDVRLQFTLPIANVNGPGVVDIGSVEIYAITVAPGAVIPPNRELLVPKYVIATIPVKPPPDVDAETTPAPPAAPPAATDERPGPGERVTFSEQLSAVTLTPTILPKPLPPPKRGAEAPLGPAPFVEPAVTTRIYVVRGVSRRGHPGAPSSRLSLPLFPPPSPAANLKAEVTEKTLVLEWTPPPMVAEPGAEAQAIHAAKAAAEWIAKPLVASPAGRSSSATPESALPEWATLRSLPGAMLPISPVMPVSFNIYEVADGKAAPLPLNPAPTLAARWPLGEPEWNRERCFVIRSVRKYGLVTIEGDDVGPHCVTPRDTYPPAAPTGLRVVASPGVLNLIWNPNSEADLAGYVVLRGEAPGDNLQAITPAPIRETTYQDTTAKPGVNYFYAIVAVDKATPANTSPQSAKQQEVAR